MAIEEQGVSMLNNIVGLIIAKMVARWLHRDDRYGEYGYYKHHLLGVERKVAEKPHLFGIEWDTPQYWSLRIVAILHDSVEDHHLSLTLVGLLWGKEVARAVDAISHRSHLGETRKDYMDRVAANWLALVVKYYDCIFNFESCFQDKDYKRASEYLREARWLFDYFHPPLPDNPPKREVRDDY